MVYRAFLILCLVLVLAGMAGSQPAELPLRFLDTIPLPGVQGRIDHLAVDREAQRLFIAALGNSSVEVIDLRRGTRAGSIKHLSKPQGVFYDKEYRNVYVSNSGDGSVRIFDADTYRSKGSVSFPDDADNLHFDEAAAQLYVGYGNGGLGIIDTRTGGKAGDIRLSGHPEGIALEQASPRVFVNIPSKERIAIVDRARKRTIVDWPTGCSGNFPIALDEAGRRLFVGCRAPAEVLVLNSETGGRTASLAIGRDVDDLFYDASQGRLYISCGEGKLIVFAQDGIDRYRQAAEVRTRPGARTSLYVPEMHRLFVAAPRDGSIPAGIMVFEAGRDIRH